MKNLKNLGEILNKEQQQAINGGSRISKKHCTSDSVCVARGTGCECASGRCVGILNSAGVCEK